MIGGNAIIRITATVMAIRNGQRFLMISVIGVSPTFDATKSMLPAELAADIFCRRTSKLVIGY